VDFPEFPDFPSLVLPDAPVLPKPVLEVPRAQVPSYKPLVVPPSVLRAPPGVEGKDTTDKAPTKKVNPQIPPPTAPTLPPLPVEAQVVGIPYTEIEVPLPSTIIMTTAVTTAFISVGSTLVATSLFKYIVMIMKPVFKQAWNKLTKKKQVQETS
jgi:hypothetical protein